MVITLFFFDLNSNSVWEQWVKESKLSDFLTKSYDIIPALRFTTLRFLCFCKLFSWIMGIICQCFFCLDSGSPLIHPFLFELGLFVLFWWFANMLRLVGIQRLRSEGYILSESNKVHKIIIPDASEKLKLWTIWSMC